MTLSAFNVKGRQILSRAKRRQPSRISFGYSDGYMSAFSQWLTLAAGDPWISAVSFITQHLSVTPYQPYQNLILIPVVLVAIFVPELSANGSIEISSIDSFLSAAFYFLQPAWHKSSAHSSVPRHLFAVMRRVHVAISRTVCKGARTRVNHHPWTMVNAPVHLTLPPLRVGIHVFGELFVIVGCARVQIIFHCSNIILLCGRIDNAIAR